GGQRQAQRRALHRIAEIVILIPAVIDSISTANHGFACENTRRPRDAYPRAEVLRVGVIPGRPCRADAAATLDVYDHSAIEHFMGNRIELVTQTEVQREIGRYFEFVLAISHVERASQTVDTLRCVVADRVDTVLDEIRNGRVVRAGIVDGVAGIVKTYASD